MPNLMTGFLARPGRRVTILSVSLCAVSSALRIANSCVLFIRRNSWSLVRRAEDEVFEMEMPHLLHCGVNICSGYRLSFLLLWKKVNLWEGYEAPVI
jgi:hypothetical protein